MGLGQTDWYLLLSFALVSNRLSPLADGRRNRQVAQWLGQPTNLRS